MKNMVEVRFSWSLYGPTITVVKTGKSKRLSREQYNGLVESGAFNRNETTCQVFIDSMAWMRL